ncbi:hypothetical protein B0H34DRAFT_799001 [Crassisporium funariophilum]|nr:hypothetical protein B0H34DRAFT_799001 [Crassisporium funariophilum]
MDGSIAGSSFTTPSSFKSPPMYKFFAAALLLLATTTVVSACGSDTVTQDTPAAEPSLLPTPPGAVC